MRTFGSDVSPTASIAETAIVWPGTQIREYAVVGEEVTIGRFCYIGVGVGIGRRSKIQNLAQLYEPAIIGEGVFIGPGVILTNDRNPRAINLDFTKKAPSDWVRAGVVVETGASIGAGAVCIGPVRVGSWSMVGAGAVVTRDVPAYGLVMGSPAVQVGWVGRTGHRLSPSLTRELEWICPVTSGVYRLDPLGKMHEIDTSEP